ncbi:hypothetical protein [Prevotella sp. 10(H)]|uniref:hypothetical protein n=1 Tax=Prevotella sp. 10(H) TaxID=1158294 RepID=UPI00068A5B99|nr:hypothetical protein [Prevotella sp. 10(H)]
MKSIKFIIYVLLFALVVSSCKNDSDLPEFPTKYARILQQSITVRTQETNKITVNAHFDSEETAAEKFTWSVSDSKLASVVTNSDNSATIEGLIPGQTVLKIESEDGKIKYFTTLVVVKAPIFDAIFIDFGPVKSPTPFNNFEWPTDQKLENLTDEYKKNTGYTIEMVGTFNEMTRDFTNDLGFPADVGRDMFFNDGIHVESAGFVLSNLNKEYKYTLVFYSSINDSNTENEYIVKGKNESTALLNTAHNRDRVAIVEQIVPDDEGKINIKIQSGPNATHWAKFYSINAMMIVAEDYEIKFPISYNTN